MAPRFAAQPIAGSPLGVEVDIDPTRPLDEHERNGLRALFREHHLLVVRQRAMSAEDQVRLGGYLGPVLNDPTKRYVSNTRSDGILGANELLWHSDIIFAPVPYRAIGLYAEDVLPGKSSTRFASAVRALRTLPADLRERATGKRAVSSHAMLDGTPGPSTTHPLVSFQPELGQALLYADELHTLSVQDMAPEKSSGLLADLRRHLYGEDNVYEHWWHPHDFVIWDNLAIHHSRPPIEPGAVGRRTLRRVVLGTATVEDQFPGFVASYNSPVGAQQ